MGATATTTSPSSTTSTTTTAAPCAPPEFLAAPTHDPVPPELAQALAARLADPRFAAVELSASVWIEGYGEVIAHAPDLALFPASNQKILTAAGALELLPRDDRFATDVRAAGAVRI